MQTIHGYFVLFRSDLLSLNYVGL